MKIQIKITDSQRVISVEEKINFGELINALEKLLPNGLWKEFELETNVTINWGTYQPIVIKEYPVWPVYPGVPYPQPQQPYQPNPWWPSSPIYCGDYSVCDNTGDSNSIPSFTSNNISAKDLNQGVYNVDFQTKTIIK